MYNFKIRIYNITDFLKNCVLYYKNITFLKLDFAVLFSYICKSPYTIAEERGFGPYGETPLTIMDLIVKECGITANDVVFELGSGRGRTSFWLREFVGCQVIGVEIIPEFVSVANRIKKSYCISDIQFITADFTQQDFRGATYLYLAGTQLQDEVIRKLIDNIIAQDVKLKIITVSYALSEYSRRFVLRKTFEGAFPWGEATLYLQEFI